VGGVGLGNRSFGFGGAGHGRGTFVGAMDGSSGIEETCVGGFDLGLRGGTLGPRVVGSRGFGCGGGSGVG